jgi:hypothetical protein
MKTRSASSSDMRATDASVSVLAAADRRKCWAIDCVSANIMAELAWLVHQNVCGYAIFNGGFANMSGHDERQGC